MCGKPANLGKDKRVRRVIVALILVCIAVAGASCSCGKSQMPEPEMPRLLAYLPLLPEPLSPDESGFVVSFSNPAELKKEHGYKEDLMLANLPVSMISPFLEAVRPAGICANLDVYFETPRPQMDIGYDVMAVKRCIEGGGVAVLEGDFDPKQVVASLEGLGYDADEYKGTAVYHFDAENYKGDEVGRELAATAGHVAALKKVVIMAATAERLQAALDVRGGQADNLSKAPQYVALAEALGPAVSAGFLPQGDQLVGTGYQEFTIKESEYALYQRSQPSCTSPVNSERWSGYWTGSDKTVKVRNIVLAATYATAQEAEAEVEGLAKRVEAHPYAEYWLWAGEPAITAFEGGVILTITLELASDAPGDILEEMISAWPRILGAD